MATKTKTAKRKPMTVAEKKQRAQWRAEWREKGLLPEPKKPLNRKAFIKDAKEDFKKTITEFGDDLYVFQALYEMAGMAVQPTLENVGAAKVMKMACEFKRFVKEVRASGRETYTIKEYAERLEPIFKA